MSEAHRKIAKEIDALLVPVGELWWDYIHENSGVELYYEDGAHASDAGSDFAAKCIWSVIERDSLR